ncbi:T6SS effector BTH_I2691 family protein [Cupriavidus necator]|uniref:T6SS effector BTH_I2691 family protein n=1 Tax=Cupriavidus necator TaxID=106590 RepID=UPI000AA3C3B1|nr:T6SS effector BTH_I2691 family protein [Cupriavidus necator]
MVMYNVDSTLECSSKPVKACNFCHHAPGLAVLPVRYAVVGPEDKNGAPPLSGNFRIENAPAQLGSGVQYILRTMRPGFLYVFHEAMQMWDAYVVMKGGHLWKVIPENPGPAKVPEAFSCCVSSHHSLESLYFTIPDPAHATRVWYAYSHVAWTKAQLNDNKHKVDVRRAHMQCLDVAAWMGNQNQPHAGRATEINKRVASFAMTPEAQQQAFRHLSATPPGTINLGEIAPIGPISGSMLADRMEIVSPGKAMMLAFNDPLAITEDLGILTNPKLHAKANNGVIWDKATDLFLDTLEKNIRANAEAQHTKEAEAAAAEAERMKTTPDGFPAYELMSVLFNGKATAERWKREDAEREATRLARKKAASDAAWKPYEDELTPGKRHQDLSPRLKALNEDVLAPIATSLAQWLMSPQLASYMQYRHDKMDLPHGYVYNESLTRCLENALDTVECRRVIQRWFNEANPENHSNLLARALLLDHKPIIDTVPDPTDQGYAAIFGILKSGLDKMDSMAKGVTLPEALAKMGLVPRLTWILADQIIPTLANSFSSASARLALYGMSLLGGVRLIAPTASVMQIRAVVLNDLSTVNPELYKQLDRTRRREDAVALGRAAKRMAQTARLVWFKTEDLERIPELSALKLRTANDVPGVRQVKAVLGSRFVNVGAVACILQGLALHHATQSFRAAGEFDEPERGIKLVGGLVSMAGTLAEQTGVVLEKAPTHVIVRRIMRLPPKAEWLEMGKKLAVRGRWIGFAGAAVGVGWDAYHAYDEFGKGHRWLFALYLTSAVSGGAASVLPLASEEFLVFLVGVPSWPFLVVLFAVNVGILLLDDPATLKWTKRCRFGKAPASERYSSLEAESFEFVQLGLKDLK